MAKMRFAIYLLSILPLIACSSDASDSATDKSENSNIPNSSEPKNQSTKSYSGPDIAGIQIGMSPEEAEAQLKAYDEAMTVGTSSQYFTYNALGKRYKTEPALTVMVGKINGGSVNIEVGLSYPPNPPKVVSVRRVHRQTSAPLTQADYAASLIEKYGKPSNDTSNNVAGSRAQRTLRWHVKGGSTQCLSEGAAPSAGNPVLQSMVKDGRRLANPSFEFTQSCASIMQYVLTGDPVTHAVGTLANVAAAAKAEFETQDWIQQLIEDKSRAGTAKPKL